MNFLRIKKVSEYDVRTQLEKRMEFTPYQKSKLIDVIRSLPYDFIKYEKVEESSSFVRLTVPFYLLYWVLLLLCMPFKWFFTGKIHYKSDSGYIALLQKWYKKLAF